MPVANKSSDDEFKGADFEEVDPGKFAICVYIQGSG